MSESIHAHETRLNIAGQKVILEALRGAGIHGPANSMHEAYAVLLEEVDEMWHEIKHGTQDRAKQEALQVAAVALRISAWNDTPKEKP